MKPLVLLPMIVLALIATALPAGAELIPLVTIDPKADDPGLRSVFSIAFDGDRVFLGVQTGASTGTYECNIMVYDESGRLLKIFPAVSWPGNQPAGTIIPDGLAMNGSNVMALDNNLIITYGDGGSVLARRSIAKLDTASLVPRTGQFYSYNTTVSVASDGEYIYVYRADNGRIQKISGDNVLVAEYPFSPVSGALALRGNEVWITEQEMASKTVVLSSDLRVIRELKPGANNLALYDDKILTSSYRDLTVRDTDFKVIATTNPLPANCYIHRMAACDGKVAIVGYNMTRVGGRIVNDHKVYLYDLTQLAPRGNPVPSPVPSPFSLKASPDIEWDARYGGSGDQIVLALIETEDGYVMAGYSGQQGYLLKVFENRTLAWETTADKYAGTHIMSVTQAPDGSYIAAGYANPAGQEEFDAYLAKIGDDGKVIWETVYGASGDELFYDVLPVPGGGYVAVGYLKPPGSKDSRLYLVRTDAGGNVTSSKTYEEGTSGSAMVPAGDGGVVITGNKKNMIYLLQVDREGGVVREKSYQALATSPSCAGNDIIRTADGGYAIAGTMMAPASGQTYTVNVDAVLLKADADGNLEWGRAFDFLYVNGNSGNSGNALRQTEDGGFVMTGYSFHRDTSGSKVGVYSKHLMFVIKTDENGILQWRKYVGDDDLTEGWDLEVTSDGGYLIAGTRGDGRDTDAYLVKLEQGPLSPAASPVASASPAPGTVTPVPDPAGASGCCPAVILPLLIVGVLVLANRNNGNR